MAKSGYSVGLEFDHLAIRAARILSDSKGSRTIHNLVDLSGDFSEDANLMKGIRQVMELLKSEGREPLATCLSGKQVSVSQITFRRLPQEEMEPALRIEMRKSIPFEVAGSTLDYQVLTPPAPESETIQVLVAVAGSGLLTRLLKVLEKVGLNPQSVDVLPVSVGNALWAYVGQPKADNPYVALHIGPQISTIVIDGAKTSFFNRLVYFSAEDFASGQLSPDLEKKLQMLAEEVARSLVFYEKSSFVSGFQEILLLGEFLDIPTLKDRLSQKTGIPVRKMDLPKKFGFNHDKPTGRFDLAVALAISAEGA